MKARVVEMRVTDWDAVAKLDVYNDNGPTGEHFTAECVRGSETYDILRDAEMADNFVEITVRTTH